jgi:hypothetical protein
MNSSKGASGSRKQHLSQRRQDARITGNGVEGTLGVLGLRFINSVTYFRMNPLVEKSG